MSNNGKSVSEIREILVEEYPKFESEYGKVSYAPTKQSLYRWIKETE